jgi:hypothetical protein
MGSSLLADPFPIKLLIHSDLKIVPGSDLVEEPFFVSRREEIPNGGVIPSI